MALNSKKLKEVQENLKSINDLGTMSKEIFKDISNQISQAAKKTKDFEGAIGGAADLQTKVAAAAQKLSEFSELDLKSKKNMAAFDKAAEAVSKSRLSIESKIRVLNSQKLNASNKEKKNLEKTTKNLQASLGIITEMEAEYEKINKANKELNSSTKWMDTMEATLSSIPGIGPLIGKPFKEASQAMRDAKVDGAKWYQSVLVGSNVLAKAFGPAAILGMLIKAADHSVEMQRSLEMSNQEAVKLQGRLSDIAFESGVGVMHQKNLLAAMQELSAESGVVRGFSDDQIKNQVFLTKKMGLGNKEAAKFSKYMTSTGKSSDVVNKEIESATKSLAKETGIVFKLSDIFSEVANTNAGLKAAYGFNNELLAEQVVKTKQLGINMEQAEKIASGMLDFESSIEAEMKAELLTGKDINLEEARRLALMGKSSEAAAEILNQVGSSHDLSKMNVIQQEALAKAVGMERNELIASVKERENLKKLGVESIAQARERGLSEKEISDTMGEGALAAYDANKASEQFEGMVTKIQMKISEWLSPEGGLGGVVKWLGEASNSSYVLYGVIASIGVIMLSSLVTPIYRFVAGAISAIGWVISLFSTKATGAAAELTAEQALLAEKLAQNAADAASAALLTTKISELGAQLALEQSILAAKMEQNAATGVNLGLTESVAITNKGDLAVKKLSNKQEARGIGFMLRKAAISAGNLMKSIGTAAMSAIQSLAAIPVVGWALGLAAAGTVAALGYKYMSDGAVGPGGEMILNTGKGQIQFDKDDTIVAGTDLGGKGNKSKSGGGTGGNMALISKIDQLISINQQILSKSPVIEMGGNEVGQGINTAEREIQ